MKHVYYHVRNESPVCLMQDTGCLGLVHGDDPEGYYGEGGGRGVHVWDRMYTRGGLMLMYDLATEQQQGFTVVSVGKLETKVQ